jgi:hypothetical protein
MNAIVTLNRVNFYCDVTRNARYSFLEINSAVNDAITAYIDFKVGDESHRNPENFQWIQQIRDDLYTLIATATPSVTNGTAVTNKYYSSIPSHFNYPADYFQFISLRTTVSGISTYARPTNYNEIGPLLEDSFKHPTNEKPYFNETATGFTVWRGTTGTMTAFFEYIKLPTEFSVGQDSYLINPGGAVLTNGLSYIAVEVSVQNGVTRQIGTQFTAVGTALTSGQVILASNTSAIPLPEKVHEEIAKRAAEILLGVSSNIQQSQVAEKFANGQG